MFSSPLFENNMFNTLAFFKKMQNVGMTQEIAEELALTFLNINNNQFENLVNKQDFSKFEIEIKSEIAEIKSEIAEIKLDMKNFVTKQEFFEFKNEIKSEMANFITKKEFYAEMKNLSLNLAVKLGIIMTTGIGALGLLIKL
jgi:hypothetical protein